MKRIIALTLAACMTVSLAACGSSNSNSKDEQGRTVISVGNWPTKEGSSLDLITKQRTEFEEENKDIAITPDTWVFDLQTFYSKAAANQLPTLFYSNLTEIDKIISNDYGADITEGLKRAGYDGKMNDIIMKLISRDGHIYTFPTDAYAVGLAVNIDLFKQAGLMNADGTPMQPKTWDEVVEFGKKIKAATGKAGFIIPTMNNNGGWLCTPIAWSFGTQFMKENNGKYTATFDSDEFEQTLKFISDLKWKHNIFVDNSLIDSDEYYKQFSLGNVGMILAAANFVDKAYKFEMPLENIGMVAMPSGPKKSVTLLGGYTATVASDADDHQIDAAIKWLEKTGKGCKLTDASRKSIADEYQLRNDENKLVGVETMSVFNDSAEVAAYRKEQIKAHANIDLNHVKLYNEFLQSDDIEFRPEEPVCAQELYGVIDSLIQEVLTNKDADIRALIKKANEDFQNSYLNNI